MIFFGKQFWTEKKPIYPLLYNLAEGKEYQQLLAITDNRDEIMELVRQFDRQID